MKVIIASDFAGFPLKEYVLSHLEHSGHTVIDVGQVSAETKVTYPKAASAAARALQNGKANKAIVLRFWLWC